MSRKIDIFEQTLSNPYEHDVFVDFTRELLNGLEMLAPTHYRKVYNNFSFYVDGYYHIGNYQGKDGEKIAVLSVGLKKGETVERARAMQRNFIKPLLENGNCTGALVAFYTPEDPEKWRLSFIRLDYEFSKGKIIEKLTPAKRYSYLVGKDEPCNTARQRLLPIFDDDKNNPGLNELEEAFSVEKVTNEFFQLYCEKFHDLREYLESNDDFMQESRIRNFTSEQFAKKLLGQIVFLYFIQKKGWLGVEAISVALMEKEYNKAYWARGEKSRNIMSRVYRLQADGVYRIIVNELQQLSDDDEEFLASIVQGKPWGTGPKDFMRKIFEGCQSADKNYFDDYLEPLFYDGLNKNRGENGFFPPLHRRIPFLNGGLFEQLDNYEWEYNDFNIPNSIFSNRDEKGIRDADGILDIFDRYNFTMNEDEPMEREVAIDPEMLGKVFENLLDVKDRKSKGAFYTPRKIVHYMCQETLIDHLVRKTGISVQAVRDLILYGEYMRDVDTVKTIQSIDGRGKTYYEIDKKRDLLISREIFSYKADVNRLKELDTLLSCVKIADLAVGSGAFPLGMLNEIVKVREVLTEYLAIEMNGFQKKSFYAYERKRYDMKINTIKNCIFACDIEASAVDIAKLRLWLSIVIEDEITEDTNNGQFDAHTKPRQLPNLESNIICGNSLMETYMGVSLVTTSEILKNDSSTQINIFQTGINLLLKRIIILQDKLFFIKDHSEKEDVKQEIQELYDKIILEQIGNDPSLKSSYTSTMNMSSKPFVLWQMYFPKVFMENGGFDIVIGNPPYGADLGDEVKDYYRKKYDEVQFKIDSYVLFIIKAYELAPNGCISFIIPNTLLNNYFLADLRCKMINDKKITHLINFDNSVFDAVVHSLIMQVANEKCLENRTYMAWNLNQKPDFVKQRDFLENENYAFEFGVSQKSVVARIRKMNSVRLENVLDLRQAIKSGNDKELITQTPAGNAKKILRGKDVLRYKINDPNLYLDYGKHLACPRDETIFNQPHILIREAGKRITATLDYDNYYIMSSLYCGIMKHDAKLSIEYMMGLINSRLFQYLMFKINFENTQGAFTKAKIYHYNQLPIVMPDEKKYKLIHENVKKILSGKYENLLDLEDQIDEAVYKIYELTEDEIEEISSSF